MPATSEILLLHLALVLAALVLVGAARWWICRGANADGAARPIELAYVHDGPRLVVFTGLAALRHHALIRVGSQGLVAVPGAVLPEGASPLHTALLALMKQPREAADLFNDELLTARTDAVGARLVRRGWILSAKQQKRMTWWGMPGWVTAAWCFAASMLTLSLHAGPGRSLQVLALLGLSVVAAVATFMLIDVPVVTRSGRAVLRRARAELDARPPGAASWPTRVAARGEPELWRLDEDFARESGAFSGELPPFRPTRSRTFISRDWWERMG
ncbi:TIGR04222 domain-containing membrane protein [Actinoplanes sp. NPDC051859]|uniref:TIGR04222 domain-containing membrane protein n=1 Tax=Actinoplanes sp. NPDC051859 TaxID=3363909 RepID=UPI00378A1914